MIGARLHHEMEAVERSEADVGDQQIERADGEETLGGVIGRRAGDVVARVAQKFDDATEGVLVVVEDEDTKW